MTLLMRSRTWPSRARGELHPPGAQIISEGSEHARRRDVHERDRGRVDHHGGDALLCGGGHDAGSHSICVREVQGALDTQDRDVRRRLVLRVAVHVAVVALGARLAAERRDVRARGAVDQQDQ